MSEKLPSLTPKKLIRILSKIGFMVYRQTGSHAILVNEVLEKQVVVPIHSKDLKKGTLHSIIKQTGLSSNEFKKLL